MRRKLALALLGAAFLFPLNAMAATITSSHLTVGLGTTSIALTLDPEGVSAGAWLAVLSGTGLTIDSISNVVPTGTDCSGLNSAASFDGQCASLPLGSAAMVAKIQVTATAVGGTLFLTSGNITDFNTFVDTSFTPRALLTVVPEPGTVSLAMLGLVGLVWSSRRRSTQPSADHTGPARS